MIWDKFIFFLSFFQHFILFFISIKFEIIIPAVGDFMGLALGLIGSLPGALKEKQTNPLVSLKGYNF